MIRVAIADEQRIVRWALREALAQQPDLEIVDEAGSIADMLAMLRRTRPDVLVIDTTLPDLAGFGALASIAHLETSPLVVVLAPHSDASYAARAIAAGAHAYVSKAGSPEELVAAIHAVTRGEQVFPPDAAKLLARGDGHPASALTAREQEVMEMLARGITNREIAHDLEISVKTVDTHRAHILKKLELRNNAELARFAVKHGYVTL